uniref:Acetyltransf_18 domain-containing protein n=1 Tax=Rhabditophanes sp. KR3021 TaxID=114890 RepID=A0AC35U3N1_9BILA
MALEIINANMPADMDYRQCRGLPFTLLCCESSESFNKIMSLKWKRTSSYISKLLQTSGFKNYDNNIYMFTEKNDLFIELMKSEYLRDFCTLNVLTQKDIANDALLNGYKIQNYYDIDYARIGNKSPGFMLGHTNKKVVKFDVRGERAVYSYIDKDGKTHFLGGGKIAALFTHFIVTCLAKARIPQKDIANDALLNGYKIQNYYDIDYARIGNKSPGFMVGHTNKKVVKFDVRGERAVYSYIDKDGKTHFLGGGKIAALFTHFIVTCLAKARIPVNQLEMCVFLEDEVNLAASHNIKYVSGIPVEIFESPIYNIHDIDVNKKFFTQTSNSLGEKFIHLKDTEIQKNLHLAVYYDESGYGSIYCSKTAKAILHDYKSNVLNIIGDESVYFNRVKYSTMLQTFLDIFNPTGSDAISTVVAVEFCQACLNMSPLDVCNMYADNPSIYRIFKPSTDEERLQFFRTVYLQEIKNSHKKIKNKLNEIESSNNLFKILFKTTDDEEQFYLYYENLNKQMPPANFKGEAQSILAKAVAVINKSIYPSSMSY